MMKMMMIKRLYIAIALVALNIMPMQAQTHAEATSQKWQGIDVTTVLGNSTYTDDNNYHHGYPFLLYNVGTGCFITQGGDWAMEGRLFFRDFGRTMYLYSNGRINSGLTENGVSAQKNSFCARPPEPFGKSWDNFNTINLTTLMDGAKQSKYNQQWTFERVPGETGDTCTYYMYQTWTGKSPNVKYYLGAAWGEYHKSVELGGKGDDLFVYLDDDRSCWTTGEVKGVTTKYHLNNGDDVELQKLYQWRLISVDEFLRVLNGEGAGLNPSVSALIPDRDFTRNSDDFFDKDPVDGYDQWTLSPLRGYTYATGTSRYTYSWGDYKKGESNQWMNNQQSISGRIVNEAWDSPLKLKVVFDRKIQSDTENKDSQAEGMKNAKNGFLPFEGVGTMSTNFQVTKPGWYELSCSGFYMGENPGFLFARVIADTVVNKLESEFEIPTTDVPNYGVVDIQKFNLQECLSNYEEGSGAYNDYAKIGTFADPKTSYGGCLAVGTVLRKYADNHKQKVWVQVSQADFDEERKTIRVGIGKRAATQGTNTTYGGSYDTDWVAIDDIRATYMGLSPAFFYEDEEDLTYLSHDPSYRENFEANEYVPTTLDGRYGGSASLQRKFTMNKWNTFSFPLPMTGEQVRYAFGDASELLEMNQTIKSGHVIDFTTVNLVTLNTVVRPGKFYLLKPSKEASYGENPRGEMAFYYDLGKMFFSTNASDAENPEYKHPVIDLSVVNGNTDFGAATDNPGTEWVTYVQTPSYSLFRVNSSGNVIRTSKTGYDLGIVDNTYSPKGSYVMSGGKMYELKRDTPLKGFRGWITLDHTIFPDETESAAGAKFAINGVIDGEDPIATSIDQHLAQPVNVRAIAGVYDLMGRKVGDTIENLPKGLYIVSGKKLLVK